MMMENKKGAILFFKDYIWIISFYILYLCFIWAYEAMDGFEKEKIYFFLLSIFFFGAILCYRYERTKRLYQTLASSSQELNNFQLAEEKAPIEKAYVQTIKKYMHICKEHQTQLEREKSNYKIMINQWVHQMKTPLSVIWLICENKKQENESRDILIEVERLHDKLTQVLNMAKLDEAKHDLKIEKVNLYESGRKAINDLKNLFLQKGIFPVLEIQKAIFVYSDKKWIQFILHQFLSNAIKYSEKDTKIIIKAKQNENEIILSVMDNGWGISKSDMPYIFDLFYTGKCTKSRGESTGLGLYMVKQIAGYLEHEVEAISIEGKGTEMQVRFKKS